MPPVDKSSVSAFAALADPTRRAILERLMEGDSSVGVLAEPSDASLPAISKQLRVLERAGLLVQEKDGRVRRCRLEAQPMKAAVDWIAQYQQFWDDKLESLANYFDNIAPQEIDLIKPRGDSETRNSETEQSETNDPDGGKS